MQELAEETSKQMHILALVGNNERAKFAVRYLNRQKLEAFVVIARYNAVVSVAADDLDADPMALNVQDGTIQKQMVGIGSRNLFRG